MTRVWGWISALILLAGCLASGPRPISEIPLRNPTAPLASQADVTLARLQGLWWVTEGSGVAPGTRLRFDKTHIFQDENRLSLENLGSGRLVIDGRAVWVYWLDADNRTAALGDPEGRQVWIMDRNGSPGDRRAAAREVLAWYGYDLRRLSGQP